MILHYLQTASWAVAVRDVFILCTAVSSLVVASDAFNVWRAKRVRS